MYDNRDMRQKSVAVSRVIPVATLFKNFQEPSKNWTGAGIWYSRIICIINANIRRMKANVANLRRGKINLNAKLRWRWDYTVEASPLCSHFLHVSSPRFEMKFLQEPAFQYTVVNTFLAQLLKNSKKKVTSQAWSTSLRNNDSYMKSHETGCECLVTIAYLPCKLKRKKMKLWSHNFFFSTQLGQIPFAYVIVRSFWWEDMCDHCRTKCKRPQ